jgi:alpha-glucosidase (family GH31 glycosyl hydrolase)
VRFLRLLSPLTALVLVSAACGDDTASTSTGSGGSGSAYTCEPPHTAADDAAPPPIHTPRWALRPWISKDISDGPDTYAFVDGFETRDIPVGVVVLDSPWETNYNTFVPNPSRYPDFANMVADLRARDIRTVLWVTQMINIGSYDAEPGGDIYDGAAANYDEPFECGWFINDANVYGWWKGSGSAIDFFDPNARDFWHRLQDPLFQMGVAGFKLDFGESYIDSSPIVTDDGDKTLQQYSEKYYEDFYAYGGAAVGTDEFVTMVRPYDKSYQFEGRFFARPEHAPVAWVGDNRRDYVGLADALDHIMRSAAAGYVVVGSDIGGYLDKDDADLTQPQIPLDSEVFMRWTAMGALTPFMQLHGRANLAPWTFPDDPDGVTDAYRFWAKLHEAMVPFFYSVAENAYAGGPVKMIEPIGSEAEWAGDYRYMLGGALLVVPVLDDTGTRDIELPAGASYYPLFDPAAEAIAGGTTLTAVDVADASRIPVFAREGAIVPLHVTGDEHPQFGSAASAGALTVVAYPAMNETTFELVDDDEQPTSIAVEGGASTRLSMSRATTPVIFRVRLDAVTGVTLDGTPLADTVDQPGFESAESGYFVDSATRTVWIKVPSSAAAFDVVVD